MDYGLWTMDYRLINDRFLKPFAPKEKHAMNAAQNKSVRRSIIKRVLVFISPLLGLYLYAQYAFYQNSLRAHPTDAGLGIAILFFFILIALFIFFLVDAMFQFKQKNYPVLWLDVAFLFIFLMPILYIHCQMGSDAFFCDFLRRVF